MAKSDHKAGTRPAKALRKPTNALGRPYWVLGLSEEADERTALPAATRRLCATCATLTKGVHALSRILCNSEAFRALQDACDGVDPARTPFDPALTESLFAALYVLSEQSEQACMALLEASLGEEGG